MWIWGLQLRVPSGAGLVDAGYSAILFLCLPLQISTVDPFFRATLRVLEMLADRQA